MPHPPLPRLLTSLVALALLLATGVTTLAQEASPVTGPSAGAGPNVGDAVVLFSAGGRREAQVAVTELLDPFEAVEREPANGFHFVQLEVVVENLSDGVHQVNPSLVRVVDALGRSFGTSFASRSSEAVAARPDLRPVYLEAGQSASGVLFFQVLDGTSVELVVYSDGAARFAVLVDRRAEVPAVGEGVAVHDARSGVVGSIAVDEIVTGLEETDGVMGLGLGESAVAVVITATAAEPGPLASPGSAFRVVDGLGGLHYPVFGARDESSLRRMADIPSQDIQGGSSATGAVIFTLPNDAVVTYILYAPEFAKLTIVGQPGGGSVVSGDELEPVAVATATGEPTEESTDDPLADGTPAALTGDCAELQAWIDATDENYVRLYEVQGLDAEEYVAEHLRADAEAYREFADAQADIDTPAIAEDAQEALIEVFELLADLLDEGAAELDAGAESEGLFAAASTDGPLLDAAAELDALMTRLEETCPDVDF